LPGVTNNDLSISYDVYVHGDQLTSFTYQENFTDVINVYAGNKGDGLSDAAKTWIRSTITRFASDAEKDIKLHQLAEEYSFYFEPQ